MELNHLKYFYEVAKLSSFTAAAKSLRVSQPAISRTVRSLENTLGVTLLDRDRRRVRVTDIGAQYFDRCREIFQEVSNLKKIAQEHQDSLLCTGEVRMGASDNICNYLLPSVIQRFCKQYHQVNFKLTAGTSQDIKDQVLNEKLEVGYFYTPLSRDERKFFNVLELGFVQFVVIVSGRNKQIQTLDDVRRRMRYIGSRRADYKSTYPALKMHNILGIEPKIFIETNNQETQKQLVLQNAGYSIVPKHMVIKELEKGTLRTIPTERIALGSPIFQIQRKGRLSSKSVSVFAEFFGKQIRNSGHIKVG